MRHQLFAAIPAEKDLQILLKESARTSRYNDLINTQRHTKETLENLAKPFSEPAIPRRDAHPVIWAKFMLTLAITLQIPHTEKFLGLSEPHNTIMHRLVKAATTCVTTKEEMQGTVEGLYCIILEGVFETNCGNLRRAWSVCRRAITVAQLMGLHRSPAPRLRRIDQSIDINPEIMWFRIVSADRYLSLLLGLPQGTYDKRMGAASALKDVPPLGRFERVLSVIASYILERNELAFEPSQHSTTQSIDADLLRLSNSMPASFWCPVDFHGLTPGEPDTLLETLRLGTQVYYFSLLIQLHLPYMMRFGNKSEHEYSKITCVNASREVLTRFIAHRSFNPVSSCSRPVDFFAFLAAMALLLAHLDAHHQGANSFLAHQRLSDRAMLDQVLERMDLISTVNGDRMTEKSAKVIRRLLDIESDAAGGNRYTTRNVGGDDDVHDLTGECEDLRLDLPYIGVVKITRKRYTSQRPLQDNAAFRHNDIWQVDLVERASSPKSKYPFSVLPGPPQEDGRPSGDLHEVSQNSTFSGRPPAFGYEQCILQYPSSYDDNMTFQSPLELPSVATDIDNWAFEGVDIAFFNSLVREMPYQNGDEL